MVIGVGVVNQWGWNSRGTVMARISDGLNRGRVESSIDLDSWRDTASNSHGDRIDMFREGSIADSMDDSTVFNSGLNSGFMWLNSGFDRGNINDLIVV